MTTLPSEKIEWMRERLTDRMGRIFRFEGGVYRAVYPAQVEHVLSLFARGIVSQLAGRGLLIESEIADLRVERFGLVIRHAALPFATKPFEWPRQFLRDAALCVLDLNLALLPHGLATVDAHGGNIAQGKACAPVWVDFGSLLPAEPGGAAVEEFRRFFTRPLRLMERAPSSAAFVRQCLRAGGIAAEAEAELRHPRWSPLRWRHRLAGELSRRMGFDRARILRAERERIARLRLDPPRTPWGPYQHKELPLFPAAYDDLEADPRRRAIFQILREAAPRRVIDLAANAGFFGFFAARLGADVLALDYDESAVGHCYETAREKARGISIACAVADVMEPPPVARSADFVLALALTHHLALGQRYTFAAIAAALARFTTDALLVEFMPHGLGGTRPLPDPLPECYRLDEFLRALDPHFAKVSVVDYPADPARNRRILIHARGRSGGV